MPAPWSPFLRAAIGFTAGLAAAWPQAALAQVAGEGVGTGVVTLGVWDWLNLVLRLAAVLAIIWGAFWAMRWYNRRVQAGFGESRALRVLETHALGPNRSMQLVRVGRRAVLVGVTPERINQLLEIDDPEEVDRLAAAATTERTAAPGAQRLAGLLSRLLLPARDREVLRSRGWLAPASEASTPARAAAPAEAARGSSAQQLQAGAAYRSARIAELQRAIEDARRGTILEDVR